MDTNSLGMIETKGLVGAIEAADANRKFVYLSADGGKAFSLKNNDTVQAKLSSHSMKLVRLSKKSFCEILDKKMAMEAAKYEK